MTKSSVIVQFNELFNQYHHRFIRYAQGYVKNETIAEDFVSEAFMAYWEHLQHTSAEDNPPAYILTIIRNKCLNHLQHLHVKQVAEKAISEHATWLLETQISTLEACDPEFLFSKEILDIIDKTLEKMPSKTRKIFILSRYDGLSHKDIAAKMQLSTKSVEFHITKALSKLRVSLKDFSYLLFFFF